MKRVLMIAFHFPPQAGSSGIQRTLRFVQQLSSFGWEPSVLTVSPRAYEAVSEDMNEDAPKNVVVRRAIAFDTARQLAIGGRYFGALARPDRWMTWKYDGFRVGQKMIRELRPDAIWSTYPIATAHVLAEKLSRKFRLPWIADFRDPMAQEGYPADPRTWKTFKRIEESVFAFATTMVFTTPGCALEYRSRYGVAEDRVRVIENGYDEESFLSAERAGVTREPLNAGALTLLHSGVVYPSERDPQHLMQALVALKSEGKIVPERLRIRFRASTQDELLHSLARRYEIEDMIELSPAISYRDALVEMLRADGLLVLQASNCNQQVPAKLYEYFRARRPLLLLTDPEGDTAQVGIRAGIERTARLDNANEIAALLSAFVESQEFRSRLTPRDEAVYRASRRGRTEELAGLLSQVCGR